MSKEPTVTRLNYHHLLYFHAVVEEGGLLPAARRLRVTHSTVAAQVRALEAQLGATLLVRSGRTLVPTDAGRVAKRYADDVVAAGRELVDVMAGHAPGAPSRLRVGIVEVLPKLVVGELLALPAEHDDVRIVASEDRLDRLLAALAAHELDAVISDAPATPSAGARAYAHLLGETEVAFYAHARLATKLRPGFPGSLEGARLVLPSGGTTLRTSIDRWLAAHGARPNVVAEISDSALLKAFGEAGHVVFPAPRVLADEVRERYHVREIGVARGVVEQFYLLTPERKFAHPALLSLVAAAKARLTKARG